MGILYNSNEKMQIGVNLEAIFNKIITLYTIDPCVKYISDITQKFEELNNNIFLLLDNIRKIMHLNTLFEC
jgi:hypothetical protein